ncbi:MAG: radical SAM protein, partial [Candidatus Aenigmatarchaeota archaeon]
MKCLFCQFYKGQEVNKKEELSDNKWIEIVKEACDLGVEKFQVMGLGEALCRKRLTIRIMKKIKKEERVGSLLTNGTLFDEASIRNIVEIGWDEILFSIDGPDAKTHDYLRGVKGTFDRVIKNLELFNKYKKKYKTDLPKIVIAPLLTRLIYNRLEDFIELAKRVEAQEICLQLMIEKTKDCKNLKLSEEETKTLKEVLIKA